MVALTPMKDFTFGCDPEMFIVNEHALAVSPDFIPGTKAEPYKVNGGAVQRDGMAAEINIDVAHDFLEFNDNIELVLSELRKMLPAGHDLLIAPSVIFQKDEFDKAPDINKELGCDPDFDAWNEDINTPPEIKNPLLRCAGGHLHIGWGEDFDLGEAQHILNCRDLTKQLDWYLAAWALRVDKDKLRRELYGRAGAYRPKTYGLEYRTLSNFWITSKERRKHVWNRMVLAIQDMRTRFMPEERGLEANQQLVKLINSSTFSRNFEKENSYPVLSIGIM